MNYNDHLKVKALREMTGIGSMICKKALIETDGDIEKARTIAIKIEESSPMLITRNNRSL